MKFMSDQSDRAKKKQSDQSDYEDLIQLAIAGLVKKFNSNDQVLNVSLEVAKLLKCDVIIFMLLSQALCKSMKYLSRVE